MIEAGVAHLPFAPVLIEFEICPSIRRFVLLDEAGAGEDADFVAEGLIFVRDSAVVLSPTRPLISLTDRGLHIARHSGESEGRAVALAASLALLMLNTRGIDKEVIESAALNKSRLSRGVAPIPTHTIVRIGTIYDHSGKAVAATGSGYRMPVHLRSGHTRMQACGPEMSERRPVFIPPVLVNYREGDDQPRNPQKLVRV